MTMGKVAIIGGSGVKDSPAFEGLEWKVLETGVSNGVGDGVVEYQEGNGVIFIPRHGLDKDEHHPKDTRYGPSVTQYGANLVAAKKTRQPVSIDAVQGFFVGNGARIGTRPKQGSQTIQHDAHDRGNHGQF